MEIKVSTRECKDVEIKCPNCGEKNIFYDVDCGETNSERCWSCDEILEFNVSDVSERNSID